MKRNYLETLVGFIVLFVAGIFAFNAYTGAALQKGDTDGYKLNASFDRIDGLNVGGDVKIAGLKVGSVSDATIDPVTYQAKLILTVDNSVKVPDDSSAEIISAGLLGDKYVALVPGGSDIYLKPDSKIKFSQSSISLESLIGKFMFGGSDDKKGDNKEEGSKPSESKETDTSF